MTIATHNFKSLLPGFLVLLLLTGCTVGPNFEDPVVETPQTYRTPAELSEDTADLEWWELFDDPLLVDLIKTALENNRDVKVAISRIAQSRAALGFTEADGLPRIDVDAGINTGDFTGSGKSASTVTNAYIVAPLSWEIDFWGKFSRANAAARAELIASEFGLKTVQLTLVSEVVSGYYELLDFHRRLAISERTLKSRIDSLIIIQHRFDKGIISELDVNQAEIQKEIAAAAIPLYERAISKAENSLSILLGRLPDAIKVPKNLGVRLAPPTIPVGLPSDILQRRPDIAQASFLLRAQTQNIGIAEALRWPSISLTGTLGVASTEVDSVTVDGGVWSIGGRLFGPIFDFGQSKQRVEIERQITQQFLFQFENSILTAFREVEDSLVEIETYRKELAAIDRQLKAAKNANHLSLERYDKGVSSYLEVLDTERTLFSTDLKQSETQQLYLNAFVNLYKSLGGGWVTQEDRDRVTEYKESPKGQY
ncbi:MAG: efflux transporter outer membrane subunit [Gammaproteobacteria bacterium]|nr:efflux transporter outer membrane subunit [Gammaproteobacteria bacterium]